MGLSSDILVRTLLQWFSNQKDKNKRSEETVKSRINKPSSTPRLRQDLIAKPHWRKAKSNKGQGQKQDLFKNKSNR